jgi:hypothetical protein
VVGSQKPGDEVGVGIGSCWGCPGCGIWGWYGLATGVTNKAGGPPCVGVAGGTECNPFAPELGFRLNELHDGNKFLAVLVKATLDAASSRIEVDLIISETWSELEVGVGGVWPATWGLASLANKDGRDGGTKPSREFDLDISRGEEEFCLGLPRGLEAGGVKLELRGVGVEGALEGFTAIEAVRFGVAGELEGFAAAAVVLIATNGAIVSRRVEDGSASSALILCETDWQMRFLSACTALQHGAQRVVPSNDEHDEA